MGIRRYPGSADCSPVCLPMGDRRRQCTSADSLIFSLWGQFAIRTTIRHHHVLSRDDVIKQVAGLVGDRHSVDLKHYDCLILVDIYRVRPIPSAGLVPGGGWAGSRVS